MGDIKPQIIQQGSVSRDADRHQPREGLPKGLLDCHVLGSCRLVLSPISSGQDVTATARPHGVPGVLCSLGSHSDGIENWFPAANGEPVLPVPLTQECIICICWWLQEDKWDSGPGITNICLRKCTYAYFGAITYVVCKYMFFGKHKGHLRSTYAKKIKSVSTDSLFLIDQ